MKTYDPSFACFDLFLPFFFFASFTHQKAIALHFGNCLAFLKHCPSSPCSFAYTSQITYLDEYYLTNQEIKLLETHSREIAKTIPDGSIVVELGSG